MFFLRKRNVRLSIFALISATAFCLHASGVVSMDIVNIVSLSGCASTPERTTLPKSIGELPPVATMILAKPKRRGGKPINVERGDILEITYTAKKDTNEQIGPVIFLGLDPQTKTVGVTSMSGQSMAIQASAITKVTRIIENRPAAVALFPILAAVGGAATGALVGYAIDQDFGPGIGAACVGIPAFAVGTTVGVVRAGWDRNYKIGEDRWKIVMPPFEPTPEVVPTPAVESETEPDAGADGGIRLDR